MGSTDDTIPPDPLDPTGEVEPLDPYLQPPTDEPPTGTTVPDDPTEEEDVFIRAESERILLLSPSQSGELFEGSTDVQPALPGEPEHSSERRPAAPPGSSRLGPPLPAEPIPDPVHSHDDGPKEALPAPNYSGDPMVHLEMVYKAFGERQILKGVDLPVFPGETVCIIGGSGTGKSVSLKHIMRLLDPDKGKVWLDGEDITHFHGDRLQQARTKLGVNFQFGALLNWLTVFENVALPLRETTDMGEKEIERRVMGKLELLSIPHARDLFPTQISGGMVKRAGLARAVVMEESLKVILYDEPTSGLDPISTAIVDDMVNEMKARLGLTQIIVTHDMASAYRTANRIAVLHEGKVVQYGTPHEIQTSQVPYVQQFVRGLSTQEALVDRKKSGRFSKSDVMDALSE